MGNKHLPKDMLRPLDSYFKNHSEFAESVITNVLAGANKISFIHSFMQHSVLTGHQSCFDTVFSHSFSKISYKLHRKSFVILFTKCFSVRYLPFLYLPILKLYCPILVSFSSFRVSSI
jgi:hypothetical protein